MVSRTAAPRATRTGPGAEPGMPIDGTAEPSSPLATGAADPMVPAFARLSGRRRETADTWTLTLEFDGRDGAPGFVAGQFNMLYAFGIGEVPISMSGDPGRPGPLVHTVRAVGPVSSALARARSGERVGVRGPFGAGWPVEQAVGADVLVIAGGLGLAPLRPALYRLLAERQRYGRLVLLYGTRSPADILFRRELERWRRRLDLEIEVTVDHATSDWRGNVGVVTTLIPRAAFDPLNSIALVCGPEIMMRFAIASLRDAGLPDDAIYLSMERNMKCAIGHCGHCQFGPTFVCKDGPVFRYDRIGPLLSAKEI
jgi:NAD(P)H-flavin reductase